MGVTNVTAAMTLPSTYQPGQQTRLERSKFASKHIKHVNSYQVKCKSKGKGLLGTCHIGRKEEQKCRYSHYNLGIRWLWMMDLVAISIPTKLSPLP
jgi:hypothetical protein